MPRYGAHGWRQLSLKIQQIRFVVIALQTTNPANFRRSFPSTRNIIYEKRWRRRELQFWEEWMLNMQMVYSQSHPRGPLYREWSGVMKGFEPNHATFQTGATIPKPQFLIHFWIGLLINTISNNNYPFVAFNPEDMDNGYWFRWMFITAVHQIFMSHMLRSPISGPKFWGKLWIY